MVFDIINNLEDSKFISSLINGGLNVAASNIISFVSILNLNNNHTLSSVTMVSSKYFISI